MTSGPAVMTAITAGLANTVASAAKPRRYLGIFNQSTSATVYVAFDTPAVGAATAGQITLEPVSATGPGASSVQWQGDGFIPGNAINIIASAAATPVTVME
jgi:hypothetical protein